MNGHFQIKKLLKNYSLEELLTAGIREVWRKIFWEKMRGSFSQNGEDLIIETFFKKNYRGRYLEIGAYHPTRLSNTYRFYKKGWRGTVIEPNPKIKKIFKELRPKDKFLNIGIANKTGRLNYYQFLIPALNTFSKKEADKSIKQGHKLEKISQVKVEKIDNVINGKIDFLSIDTEGFDLLILENWPWQKAKPKVICVEDKSVKLKKILKDNDYLLKKETQANLIFVSK